MDVNLDLFEQIVNAYNLVCKNPGNEIALKQATSLVHDAFGADTEDVKASLQYLHDACLNDDDAEKRGLSSNLLVFLALNDLEYLFKDQCIELNDRLNELMIEYDI